MAKATTAADGTNASTAQGLSSQRASGLDPVVLAAGAALAGAVAGALVPRSETELRLLAPLGKHVKNAAGALGREARLALSAELAAVPVVGQIAADQIGRVIESVVPSATADVPDAGREGTAAA